MPIEFTGLLPLWIVVGGSLLLLSWEVLLKEAGRKAAPLLTMAVLLLSLDSLGSLLYRQAIPGPLFHGSVVADADSLTLQGICLLSALLTCVFSASYLRRERAVTGEYYALLLLAAAGMSVLVLSGDFLTFFVGLELMSLASYVLAGYLRVKERSVEAALKYFLMGVFASAFLLYGVALLYGASGCLDFAGLRRFLMDQGGYASALAKAGAALVLVGFGFKTALVPFHGWAPDVYDGAPAPVAGFLSTGVKAAAFGAFGRLFIEVMGLPGGWVEVFVVLALATMTFGNLAALAQGSVKRMLAYSSVAHAGYLMVGLCAAATATATEAERGVAFYLLAYTLMTAGAFGWLGWAGGPGEADHRFEDFRGFGLRHPWMGLPMAVFLFSLAGMTPLAGFFAKYYLFKLAVDQGMVALVVLAVLNSFLSAYYYLKVVAYLYMKPAEEGKVPVPLASSWSLRLAFFLCAMAVILAGFLRFPF